MTEFKPPASSKSHFHNLLNETDQDILELPMPSETLIAKHKRRSMAPQERWTTAVTKKQLTCRGKVRYKRLCVALRDADQIMQNVSLMFECMTVYVCRSCTKSKKSPVFHKGHDRRMPKHQRSAYAESSRRRARERQSMTIGPPDGEKDTATRII